MAVEAGLRTSPRGWAAIDLLRFACALLVLAHHFGAALVRNPNPAAAGALAGAHLPDLARWTGFGFVGVEIFFVISGYVIAASAESTAPGVFLYRRAQRLLPAAWACASLTFMALWAVAAMPAEVLAAQWLRSVAFWPMGQTIDPSYWTLGIESSFYLMVAAQLRGAADHDRLERLAWGIGAVSAMFWVVQKSEGLMYDRSLQLLLLVHGVFFATGGLLHAAHRGGLTSARAVGLALFLGAGMLEIAAHNREMAAQVGLTANPTAPLLAFAAGVAVVASCRCIQPLLGSTRRHAATLGLMSYPLYLLHQQIGAVSAGLFARGGLPAWLGLAAAIPLLLALAWVVVRYVEPALRTRLGAAFNASHAPRPDRRASASPSIG